MQCTLNVLQIIGVDATCSVCSEPSDRGMFTRKISRALVLFFLDLASPIRCSTSALRSFKTPIQSTLRVTVTSTAVKFYSTAKAAHWLIELDPTRHEIGHFGDVLHSQCLGLVLKNWIKHNKSKHASITKYTTTQNEQLKPCLVATYDLQPKNRTSRLLKK